MRPVRFEEFAASLAKGAPSARSVATLQAGNKRHPFGLAATVEGKPVRIQFNRITTHDFRIVAWWPLGATTVQTLIAETEETNLDAAVDALLARIRGFVTDHTAAGS
jgi:hypothetical protein